jgi:hypothetical protein
VATQVPPYRGPYMKTRLTSLAATNQAVQGKIVHGVFDYFGRETMLIEGDIALESVGGRFAFRNSDQAVAMVTMRQTQLSEQAAELDTLNSLGGGTRGRGLTAFHDIVEGDIENKAYVRPPLAVRRGLKVIDDFETEEGVD